MSQSLDKEILVALKHTYKPLQTMPHFRPLLMLADRLSYVQSIIAMDNWKNYPQFRDDQGFGRIALLACILSTILGVNIIVCLQFVLINQGILSKDIFGKFWTDETLQLAMQWSVYVIVLCAFHLGEFFTTAVCNPSVTSADSFMVRDCIYNNVSSCIINKDGW